MFFRVQRLPSVKNYFVSCEVSNFWKLQGILKKANKQTKNTLRRFTNSGVKN